MPTPICSASARFRVVFTPGPQQAPLVSSGRDIIEDELLLDVWRQIYTDAGQPVPQVLVMPPTLQSKCENQWFANGDALAVVNRVIDGINTELRNLRCRNKFVQIATPPGGGGTPVWRKIPGGGHESGTRGTDAATTTMDWEAATTISGVQYAGLVYLDVTTFATQAN